MEGSVTFLAVIGGIIAVLGFLAGLVEIMFGTNIAAQQAGLLFWIVGMLGLVVLSVSFGIGFLAGGLARLFGPSGVQP